MLRKEPKTAVTAYISQLNRALRPLPTNERDDIVKEIASNLDEGLATGESSDDLLARLGPAEAVAAAMVEERLITLDLRRSPSDWFRLVSRTALGPFAVSFALFVGLATIWTAYSYGALLQKHGQSIALMPKLIGHVLPAIVFLALPIATLFVGLVGLPRLASVLSLPRYRRALPAIISAMLGFGAAIGALGLAIEDAWVVPANKTLFDLHGKAFTVDSETRFVLKGKEHVIKGEMDGFDLVNGLTTSGSNLATLAELPEMIRDVKNREASDPDVQTDSDERSPYRRLIARLVYDYHSKLAMPAMSFAQAALGLAIGLRFVRRRPQSWLVMAVFGIGIILGNYAIHAVMDKGVAEGLSFYVRFPQLAAWAGFATSLAFAVRIGIKAYRRQPMVMTDA